ncbi:sulfate transporter, partial [Striga asiatica]
MTCEINEAISYEISAGEAKPEDNSPIREVALTVSTMDGPSPILFEIPELVGIFSSRDIAIGPVAVVSLLLRAMLQNEIDPVKNAHYYHWLDFTAALFASITQAALCIRGHHNNCSPTAKRLFGHKKVHQELTYCLGYASLFSALPIMELRLLNQWVRSKMKLKTLKDCKNCIHVAIPKLRDGKERPPCIPSPKPEAVLVASYVYTSSICGQFAQCSRVRKLQYINSRTCKSVIEEASGKHLPSSQSLIPILKRNNSVTHIFTGN